MIYRTTLFTTGSATQAILALFLCVHYGESWAEVRQIETRNATLSLDTNTGDLVGLSWKNPAVDIIGEARLGENFRILLPHADYEASYFYSREQRISKTVPLPDGVSLQYDFLRNKQEKVDVKVIYEIRDTGSQLQFTIQVDNGTDRKLAEVVYGMVGGQQGIQQRADTESLIPGAHSNLAPHLFSQYYGGGGSNTLGVRYEIAAFQYPGNMSMGWIDVFNRKADLGYYYANQDPETRATALYTEMHPYTKPVAPRDNWPSSADLPRGEPLGLTMGWVNFPYAGKGIFRAGPVAMQVHEGDWHAGSAIYRSWFDRHFAMARPPSWLRKEMAWLTTIVSNQEDVITHRFDELPSMAADAKKYGVTTFEIIGWNTGGINRNYPNYQPDPRLGTREEFRKALADIRAMGVHPLLYVDIQNADTATKEFRTELSRYAVRGRWAQDLVHWGNGEGTIRARMEPKLFGTVVRRNALVSPAHPAFRKFLIEQYLQRVQDGAEGFQIDHALMDGILDFNPNVPLSPDKSLTQGILMTFRELLEQARRINPSMALASENLFDRAFPYIDVSYLRMNSKDAHSTALRYTFPEWTSTIFGENPGDFAPMNNGLRYGLVWALAPRHYHDSLDEPLTQPLSRYVSELIRIRHKYQDLLFLGRFDETFGATVTGDADAIRYSVFKPMDPGAGARACVIVNFGDREESATVNIDGKDGQQAEISMPFRADRKGTLPLRVVLPPQQAAVVVVGK